MKRLFVDTNIVLDLLARREPHYDGAAWLFSLADKQLASLHVSALTLTTTHYILRQQLSAEPVRQALIRFKALVHVVDLSDKILELALNDSAFRDFEDAVQYYSALECRAEALITRNERDFKASALPVFSAVGYMGVWG